MMLNMLCGLLASASRGSNGTVTSVQYATKRIIELENLLLVEVTETVWPAEGGIVFVRIENTPQA